MHSEMEAKLLGVTISIKHEKTHSYLVFERAIHLLLSHYSQISTRP